MTGNMLFDFETAFRIVAFEQTVRLAMNLRVAFGTRSLQVREFATDFFVCKLASLFDKARGQFFDLAHEGLTSQFALLDLFQLVFPFTGHFRRAKIGDSDFLQQIDKRKPFIGNNEIAFL